MTTRRGVRDENLEVLERSSLSLSEIADLLDTLLRDPIRYAASVQVTCAAAGDYAAGDAISASATDTLGRAIWVPDLARPPGGVATIMTIVAKCSEDAVLASLRLFWFLEEPQPAAVEMDDNVAFDLKTAIGRNICLGNGILLNAFNDRGTAAAMSTTSDIREPLRCGPGRMGLWMLPTFEVAEANETAGMTIDFEVYTL